MWLSSCGHNSLSGEQSVLAGEQILLWKERFLALFHDTVLTRFTISRQWTRHGFGYFLQPSSTTTAARHQRGLRHLSQEHLHLVVWPWDSLTGHFTRPVSWRKTNCTVTVASGLFFFSKNGRFDESPLVVTTAHTTKKWFQLLTAVAAAAVAGRN